MFFFKRSTLIAINTYPGVGETKASKLLARKRPRLLPVIDSVIRRGLHLGDQPVREMREALASPVRRAAIESIHPPHIPSSITTDPPSRCRCVDAAQSVSKCEAGTPMCGFLGREPRRHPSNPTAHRRLFFLLPGSLTVSIRAEWNPGSAVSALQSQQSKRPCRKREEVVGGSALLEVSDYSANRSPAIALQRGSDPCRGRNYRHRRCRRDLDIPAPFESWLQ